MDAIEVLEGYCGSGLEEGIASRDEAVICSVIHGWARDDLSMVELHSESLLLRQ